MLNTYIRIYQRRPTISPWNTIIGTLYLNDADTIESIWEPLAHPLTACGLAGRQSFKGHVGSLPGDLALSFDRSL